MPEFDSDPFAFRLLAIAAWDPELVHFRARWEEAPIGRVLCSGAQAVGVGLVDAALGAARLLSAEGGAAASSGLGLELVFLGTAGASRASGLAIHDVVVARSVSLVDFLAVEGRAKTPFDTRLALDGARVDAMAAAGAKPVHVATTVGITIDDGAATTLSAAGEVEHLEAFAVARACATAGVPCTIVLGIANHVGADGSDRWRANHVAASARAAEIALEGLRVFTRRLSGTQPETSA